MHRGLRCAWSRQLDWKGVNCQTSVEGSRIVLDVPQNTGSAYALTDASVYIHLQCLFRKGTNRWVRSLLCDTNFFDHETKGREALLISYTWLVGRIPLR